MSNNAKLSVCVVIPSYNSEKFIVNTLNKVREQTRAPDQVVVVNDGSTDRTLTVLNEYKKQWHKFPLEIVNQENGGIGAARNAGIARAKTDFISFLDADDTWYPEKLEKCMNFLEEQLNVDVLCHAEKEVSATGERILRHGKIGDPAYESLLLDGNKLSPSATLVRKKNLDQVNGFSTNLDFNSAEDYDLWLRLAQKQLLFVYFDEILGQYNREENSVTSRLEYHSTNSFNVFSHHVKIWGKENGVSSSKIYEILLCRRLRSALQLMKKEFTNKNFSNILKRLRVLLGCFFEKPSIVFVFRCLSRSYRGIMES
ncbi:MAG: glycosyltransferase family 2 protein [Gammaproteobacteria bacterium]|nr:glycosyltransferase family 2 protein [Gammaproteobacteria bacterium]